MALMFMTVILWALFIVALVSVAFLILDGFE